MLKDKSKHFKSVSCLSLQKDISNQQAPIDCRRRSEQLFVPFHSERKLGKLIVDKDKQNVPKRQPDEKLI